MAVNKNYYVGNLAFHTTASDLTQVFSQYGQVARALVVVSPETGESRGFGYVEMSEGGDQAVAGLNGSLCHERSLTVHQTKPREDYFGTDEGDGHTVIPVRPVPQCRAWPLPIVEDLSSVVSAWAGINEVYPATRNTDAYGVSQKSDDNDRPDARASRLLDEST